MHPLILAATCSFAILLTAKQNEVFKSIWQEFARLAIKKYVFGSNSSYLYGLMTKKYNTMVKNYKLLPVFISNFDPAKNL